MIGRERARSGAECGSPGMGRVQHLFCEMTHEVKYELCAVPRVLEYRSRVSERLAKGDADKDRV